MSGFTSAGTRARPSLTSGLTARRLFFPFLLTSAVSSLAINLRNARDDFRQLQSRHAARLSVLNGIIDKLESGQHVRPDFIAKEYERVGIVERAGVVDAKKQDSNVGWKEMLLGRKRTEQDRAQDARELRDIEEGELPPAVSSALHPSSPQGVLTADCILPSHVASSH